MTRRVRTRGGALGFLAGLLCVAGLASTASAANPANSNKPYSIVICGNGQIGCTSNNPAVIGPSTADTHSALTVTFTNNNTGSGIKLGSDNLSAPSGFSVIGAALPGGSAMPPCPAPGACFSLLSSGTTIGFRNLNLSPEDPPLTISLSATTPSPSTSPCTVTSPCTWSDEAKQSNDFSGTGNDLNANISTSAYHVVTASVAPCPRKQGCTTTLANGGTGNATGESPSEAGSISATITTSSGKNDVTQTQSLDFGAPLAASLCSGVSSMHYESGALSAGGSDRTITTSITTTPFSGYRQEFCLETDKQFTQKICVPLSCLSPTFGSANQTTLPSGTVYTGLLPDCVTQINCAKNPGVQSRQTNRADGTTTTTAVLPPGYDFRAGN